MNRSNETNTAQAPPHASQEEANQSRRWLNVGVLAHVDAGKTSLTEALLYAGGALDRVGRVDDGTTQTDTLAMEQRRGITIRTAVASFNVGDVTVNLVDTPGHPDFIAEVDRSLAVLDGAVLVVSAVEGVQAQTIVLHRALRRLSVPCVIFINKIDRAGADTDRVLAALRRRLSPALMPLGIVDTQGTSDASFSTSSWDDLAVAEVVTGQLAEHDDELLEEWVRHDRPATVAQLWEALGRLTRRAAISPVVCGSARTGAGVPDLVDTLIGLLSPQSGNATGPVSGQVFKIERTPSSDRVCSIRMRAGTLTVRDVVDLGPERIGTVTAMEVHEPGGSVSQRQVVAGQIARVHGLTQAQLGDWVGPGGHTAPRVSFPAPALQTAIVARERRQHRELHRALSDLADVDPLIRLRPDDQHGGLQISVYGEVQQQVIAETLSREYGIDVDLSGATVICVERPAGRASAILRIGDLGHRYGYTLGVTLEPAPPGSGRELVVTADRISLPMHVYANVDGFRDAIFRYLETPLGVGPHGWSVTDLRVTVTDSGYSPPGPKPAEVRRTVADVVNQALERAGTVVCEPVDRFWIETPNDTVSSVLSLLGKHHAVPDVPQADAGLTVLTGTVSSVDVDVVRAGLSTAAHGEAVLESVLHHYAPAPRDSHR